MAEVDLLIKLFDTLKDSIKDIQNICQALLTNQTSIGNYMKNLPMEEVKGLLKDHSKESTTEIGTCKETVEIKSNNLLQKINSMDNKINKMIIVITVAFALLTVAYFVVRSTTDVDKIKKEIATDIENEQKKEHQEIIDAVTEAMKKYHKE